MAPAWWIVAVLVVATVPNLKHGGGVDGAPQVPCYFIFGDSLADNGNNNNLNTLAKVDYPPYGIDFPSGPTGRFCNGRTIVDVIAELLGFDHYMPPFATAVDVDLFSGVNYASGTAGILDETGQALGERISLNQQLKNHRLVISRLIKIIGLRPTARYLRKCLYSVGLGNNDYLNNYFQPEYYSTSQKYTLEEFTQLLINQHKLQLQTLYRYGARKIAVFGLGKIGCAPGVIYSSGTNTSGCVEAVNSAAQLFNSKLVSLIDQLNGLGNAQFIYINNYKMGEDVHGVLDFKVNNTGCCRSSSTGHCIPNEAPCEDRTKYMFWDLLHPTETFNIYYANRSYQASSLNDSYPFDIRQLVLLGERVGVSAAK